MAKSLEPRAPLFKVGDIVQHKASYERAVVAGVVEQFITGFGHGFAGLYRLSLGLTTSLVTCEEFLLRAIGE